MTGTENNRPLANANPPQVRRGPALVILGIALFIFLGGGTLALAFGGSSRADKNRATLNTRSACAVWGVKTVAARTVLRDIGPNGVIPTDIVNSLFVPSGSTLSGTRNLDGASGQFDRELDLLTSSSMTRLVGCYRSGLQSLGWKLSGVQRLKSSSGARAQVILAQHQSSDGFYWEVGVTVTSRPIINSHRPSPAGSAARSGITLRLLEVPDAS